MNQAWASLLQTVIWAGIIVSGFFAFRSQLIDLLKAFVERIRRGDEVELPGGVRLRGAPEAIRKGEQVVVTEEGTGGISTPTEIHEALLKKQFSEGIVEELYLVHEASVTRARKNDRPGLYRVRLWVEGYTPADFNQVERVSYRLYDNEFANPVVTTESRDKDFEIWLNVYGEFTVIAYVERRDQPSAWLTRYLDLPGRPPE